MSKERLEEMNNKVTGLNDSDGDFTDEVKMSVDTYAWFYEQAERLHGTNRKMGYIDMYADCNRLVGSDSMKIYELEQQNKRYREVLNRISITTKEGTTYRWARRALEGEE